MSTVRSLENLGEAWKDSFVPPPELPEVSLFTIDETVAEKLREGATKVREWVVSTLTQINAVKAASREVQELNEDRVAEAEVVINGFFCHETKAYKRAALLGMFQQRLAESVSSRKEAQVVIDGLVEQGFLLEAQEGPIKVFTKTYAVPADSTFKEPEIEEVSKFLGEFIGRALQAEWEAKRQAAESLYARTELTLDEFRAGKAGSITLGVPPEPVFELDGVTPKLRPDDGRPMWRGGGTLLVKNDGDKVIPVSSSGNIQRGVDEAIRLNVYLLRYTLGWAYPPKVEGLDLEHQRKLTLLWNLLKRGITAMEKETELKAEKARLIGSTDAISQKEFFLEGKIGVCLVELEKPWEPQIRQGEPTVYISPCYFLAERFFQGEGEEQQVFLRLVAVPTNIEDYLAGYREDYPEGDRFSGCPQPLRAMFQAAFGQAQKEENLAVKYGRNGNTK